MYVHMVKLRLDLNSSINVQLSKRTLILVKQTKHFDSCTHLFNASNPKSKTKNKHFRPMIFFITHPLCLIHSNYNKLAE